MQGAMAQQGGIYGVLLNKVTKGLSAIKTISFPSVQFVMTPKILAGQEYAEVFCTPVSFKVALTLMRVDGSLQQLIG